MCPVDRFIYGLIGKIHTYLRARGGKHCIKKFFQELIRDHHRKHKVVELIILMYIGKEARHYYAEPIVMYGPRGMFARGTATEILSGNKYRTGISRVMSTKPSILFPSLSNRQSRNRFHRTPLEVALRNRAGIIWFGIHILDRQRHCRGCYYCNLFVHFYWD